MLLRLLRSASSNPVDAGWIAVRTRYVIRAGNSRVGSYVAGLEATVKVYGVAVAMPQG